MIQGSTRRAMTGAWALPRAIGVSRTLHCSTSAPSPAPKFVPKAREIADFLIGLAEGQNESFEIRGRTLLREVPGLNLTRLSNLFFTRNPWKFQLDWRADGNRSFIENADGIRDLMLQAEEQEFFGDTPKPAASTRPFSKSFHQRKGEGGGEVQFLPRGFHDERVLAEVKMHLHLSVEQADALAEGPQPVDLVLASSRVIVGKTRKTRRGPVKEDDRIEVRIAISSQGWKRPNVAYLSLKSLFCALAWPLTLFALRPRISWPKGQMEENFSFRREEVSRLLTNGKK